MTAPGSDMPYSTEAPGRAELHHLPEQLVLELISGLAGHKVLRHQIPLEVRMGGIGIDGAIKRPPSNKVRIDEGPEWGEAVG